MGENIGCTELILNITRNCLDAQIKKIQSWLICVWSLKNEPAWLFVLHSQLVHKSAECYKPFLPDLDFASIWRWCFNDFFFSDKTSVFKLMNFPIDFIWTKSESNFCSIYVPFPPHVHKTPINLDRSCKHILRKRENNPHCVSLTSVSCYICCWARFKILKIQGKQISLALIMHLLMCAHIASVYLKTGILSLLAISFPLWKEDLQADQVETHTAHERFCCSVPVGKALH